MSASFTHRAGRIVLAAVLLVASDRYAAAQTHSAPQAQTPAQPQAQTQARVQKDQSIVWNLSMATPITTVGAGTVLDVVGRTRDFYVVRLPPAGGRPAGFGRIAISQVEIVQGVAPTGPPPPGVLPDDAFGAIRPNTVPAGEEGIGVFAFGNLGVTMWNASNTFEAVLGSSTTPMFGGGGQVRFNGRIIIEGAVERFSKNGERVFVTNGQVFKLGIRDTVRVTPVLVTALYRQPAHRVAFYGGGGFGQYFFKEESDFADPSENISDRFTGYHVVFGAEFGALASVLKAAVEVQVATVPDALGTTGASLAFGEHNLGGIQVRVKILGGR